jgi:hypothetical protein
MVIDACKKFKGCFIISGDGNSDHPSAPKKNPCSMRKRECKKLEALSLEKSNATGSSITKLSRSITLSIDDNFCS